MITFKRIGMAIMVWVVDNKNMTVKVRRVL